MPEKISDIYYPKDRLPSELEPEFEFKKEPQENVLIPKTGSSKRRIFSLWFLGILLLFIIAVLSYFLLPKAQIEIWPATQNLSFKEIIEINTQLEKPDFVLKVFPGKKLELELEKSQEFSASGKTLQGAKAKGVIQLYNSYSTANQVLVANTRFISADGKLFRSLKRVIIPGGQHDEKGKLIPGSLDVEVVAAENGEEYNIDPSTFSIPGFAGTPKYTAFYGKSSLIMSGGFKGEAPQVTKADLDQAKNSLSEALFTEGRASLRNQVPSDFILIDDVYQEKIIEISSGAEALEAVSNFNFKIKGTLRAMAFKQSDLEKFSKEFIFANMPEEETFSSESFWKERKIQEESLKLNYRIYSLDWEKDKMSLELDFSVKVYRDIDVPTLKRAIFSKSLKEVEISLASQPEVKRVDVKFWPFWVSKAPQNSDKIKIKLNID